MTIKIELTEAQVLWLHSLFVRGMDGFFENNKRDRNMLNRIIKRFDEYVEFENPKSQKEAKG